MINSNVVYRAIFSQCAALLKQLNNSGIPYSLIKGEPLSIMAYGIPGSRQYHDIDILVVRDNLEAVESILRNNGFCQCSNRKDRVLSLLSSHQLQKYTKKAGNLPITIDINFDIFWGEYNGPRIDITDFLADVVEMNIYGVTINSLTPLKAVIQIILHHYKDMNSIFLLATRNSIKHEMFKDVYYLLKNNLETISLDELYSISAEYAIVPYVYYVLYHIGELYDDIFLQQYIEAFKTPEGETLLNCYGLNESERHEWRVDFKTRLESENLYDLIKNDLTERDLEKIAINKRIFLGVSE